ncbi:hypothetical protein FBUS_06514 [Fasciolopsis buskii]|uniref:Synergin gamma C-terminal domain-containing protein n=1 Tax=Fasciolopsis buskii TaxID=27845 RepID=A0A8E0RYM2_9TREM|nr:hypothetical protein FBUS_06514 [Fasciolopsis buski]
MRISQFAFQFEMSSLESVQHEWLRCIVQCAELMRESLDALQLLNTNTEKAEFNETEEGFDFFHDILEVYRVANRIKSSAERLALLHAPLQARFVEIKASMLKLFQYITKNDIKKLWTSELSQPSQDAGSSLDALAGFISPNILEPLCGATGDATKPSTLDDGLNQTGHNAKACEVLQRKIDELTRINHHLAAKTAFLSSSLITTLLELEEASASKELSGSAETKFTHDVRQQLIRLGFLPPVDKLTNESDRPLSVQFVECQASASLEPVLQKPSQVPSNEINQSLDSQESIGAAKSQKELIKQDNAGKSVEFIEPKMDESDDFDDSDTDSETIRTAFRMFAKQIGPTLKREHRQRFGTVPTQSWLADQLLARWDALDRHERRAWHQQIRL